MNYVYVRMTIEEADARDLQRAWSALVCWRNYHPEDREQIDVLFDKLRTYEMTGREASLALFDIQYASANRPKNQ